MPANGGFTTAQAKEKVLKFVAQGDNVAAAMKKVGRSEKTYFNWMAADADFSREIGAIRGRRKKAVEGERDPALANLDFAEWRKKFLGRDTYLHQHQWIDLLEGREPRDLHPQVVYQPGRSDRVIINTPPFMAKSTTVTQEYVTYRLCKNPNLRVIIVSETKDLAEQFLYSIKRMLTEPFFADLQEAYAPVTGFRPARDGGTWSADKIYLANRGEGAADAAAKDPSVQAIGMRGRIYGQRADLIILDDSISLRNASEYEKQTRWLIQDVISRAKDGKVLLIGTRVGSADLYSYLTDDDNYPSTGRSPWTYLAQPMVLEFDEEPKDWVTLWPRSSQPPDENGEGEVDADGMYAAWDGPKCDEKRSELAVSPSTWALVYMQQSVAEDATFHPLCVKGSTDGRRKVGPLNVTAWGGRPAGMAGLHVIGSIDPASTGEAFLLIYAVDRQTKERWVLNAWMHRGASNTQLYAEKIEQLTIEYGIHEWVIESNAYGSWLVNDERITAFLRARGVSISPHATSKINKPDPDFGVASCSSLFGSLKETTENGRLMHARDNLIHLPDPDHSAAVKQLIEQLIQWQPHKLGRQLRQDGPMALWFAELRARLIVGGDDGPKQNFMRRRYLTGGQRARQMVVPSHSNQALAPTHD